MKKVADQTKAALWEKVGAELEHGVRLFVQNGAKVKGMKAKDALAYVLCDIVKIAYIAGLDRGYDMGAAVFGDGSEDDEPPPVERGSDEEG